jgi:hypothetical protein
MTQDGRLQLIETTLNGIEAQLDRMNESVERLVIAADSIATLLSLHEMRVRNQPIMDRITKSEGKVTK